MIVPKHVKEQLPKEVWKDLENEDFSKWEDITKYPERDFLVAVAMYPKSTLEDLKGYGFDRFEDSEKYNPKNFLEKGLIDEKEGRMEITRDGIIYLTDKPKEHK